MSVLTTDNSKWLAADHHARSALYKIISSNAIHTTHFKDTSLPQTANAVWLSLKTKYQKDSCATRFELKKCLYNPTHDTSKPILAYIQDIINVAESLSNLGHPPATINIVDSILMNLDPSFAIVHILLTTQTSELTLTAVKKTLTDQEDTMSALDGGSGDNEQAMYMKCRGKKTKQTRKQMKKPDSDLGLDDPPSYDWLNQNNKDVCHQCGRPGHCYSWCIADMPQSVKDKIIKMARKQCKSASPSNDHAVQVQSYESYTLSDSDSDSGDEASQSVGAYFSQWGKAVHKSGTAYPMGNGYSGLKTHMDLSIGFVKYLWVPGSVTFAFNKHTNLLGPPQAPIN
ncbi:hypothetical protein K439DRAFT_1619992 [Ramaria rubella]|nr:hypothetical protein K439DRAFT_1619992 [Ramaria rubella]